MQYKLRTPVTREDLAPLRTGDTVLLSGAVYTARDAAHKRMMELLDTGGSLPFPVEGSAVYYVGPTPERPGQVIGSAGPTTSGRMDAYSPRLLDLGQLIMIGKGTPLAGDSWRACGQHYLSALPDSSLRTFDLPHDLYRRRPKELADTIHRFLLEHL